MQWRAAVTIGTAEFPNEDKHPAGGGVKGALPRSRVPLHTVVSASAAGHRSGLERCLALMQSQQCLVTEVDESLHRELGV